MGSPGTRSIQARGHPWHLIAVPVALALMLAMLALGARPGVVGAGEHDPGTLQDCMQGGWEGYGFQNQGLCIQFVNTGRDTRDPLPLRLGPTLWLDASGLALGDGDSVSTWYDLSGNENHADAPVGSEPTFKTEALNNLPVVQFDPVNEERLETAAFTEELTQANTIFVVWETFTSGTMFALDGITIDDRHSVFQGTLGDANIAAHADSTISYGRDTPFAALITTALFNGADSEVWENGDTKASGDAGNDALTGALIGSRVEYRNFLAGNIAEILIYDRALTDTEREAVEAYLADKYGLD